MASSCISTHPFTIPSLDRTRVAIWDYVDMVDVPVVVYYNIHSLRNCLIDF